MMDANDAERFSTALVWRLLEAIDSLETRLRQLDGRLTPGEEGLRDIRAERGRLRERLRLAETELKRARADKKRANRLRQAAERRAENWARRHARTERTAPNPTEAPIRPRKRTVPSLPSLPSRAFPGEGDEVLRLITVDLDVSAEELDRLGEVLGVNRGRNPAAVLLGVLVVMVVVAVVVGTLIPLRPDHQNVRKPTTRQGDGLSASKSHSASVTPAKTPPRLPSRTPSGLESPSEKTTPTPRPSPSPSPSESSRKPAPRPPAPRETASTSATADQASREIFIVRGHGNEMNVNLTGFEPDEDVTIYAYTDTDDTDGPYDRRTHTIRADGTREFGAFPMEAPGRYWVVALGVTSNVVVWTG
ncbi:hypothetical protein [Streptomyces jumonjinensis]|uniref:Uncharacterized protein n=1 Tax=Streptomyces jumonjinensis TaxID=1945 RepID=A0A646KHJ2_STRJU|nr:hypothetical protein [Streptomyces jumonjinensis]MQT00476.1 hypothetical protein [Streptomyces jumonjinensis]